MGSTAVLRVDLAGRPCEALLDTGSSESFISPQTVDRLEINVQRLATAHTFMIDNGEQLRIDRAVKRLKMWCGRERFLGDFLVGPVPYDVVLGLDWLTEHKVAWYSHSDKLRTYVNGKWCELPAVRTVAEKPKGRGTTEVRTKTPEEQAYDIFDKQVAGMSP